MKATIHTIDFHYTKIIVNNEHRIRKIIGDAMEIDKQPNNLNTRHGTHTLPTTCKPVMGNVSIKTNHADTINLTGNK